MMIIISVSKVTVNSSGSKVGCVVESHLELVELVDETIRGSGTLVDLGLYVIQGARRPEGHCPRPLCNCKNMK